MPDLKIEGENEVKNIYKSKNNITTIFLNLNFFNILSIISVNKDICIPDTANKWLIPLI